MNRSRSIKYSNILSVHQAISPKKKNSTKILGRKTSVRNVIKIKIASHRNNRGHTLTNDNCFRYSWIYRFAHSSIKRYYLILR